MGTLVIYEPDDESTVSVKLEGNTIWLAESASEQKEIMIRLSNW